MRALEEYDFVSPDAARRFEEVMDHLRQQLLNSQFQSMAGAMADTSPEQIARLKDMLAALNEMIDQRQRGEEPDFEGFMERYGDFFPDNPRTLDELLEQMAHRMAAMQAFMSSLTPEQRAQLQALSDQLLDDMDLRWQVDQPRAPPPGSVPGRAVGQPVPGERERPTRDGRGRPAHGPAWLARPAREPAVVQPVTRRRWPRSTWTWPATCSVTTAPAAWSAWPSWRDRSSRGRPDRDREGRLELTPRGLRRLGASALGDLFQRLDKDRLGQHQLEREGPGHERSFATKPYELGDPFNLDIERTVRNALQRGGGGTPVELEPADFEVERTETLTRTSTVLLLDLSLSMPMKDNFLAAKKVAMALHSLISTQYPRDFLGLVVFSEVARTLLPAELPRVSWDFVFGTNIQHALLLARRMLARQAGTKQVLMVTDGEPTAHILPDGEPFFSYPPARETLEATMAEVMRCTAEGIRINTFMLDADPSLAAFVERLARVNRGRVFFTTPETLGSYVLVDYLEQKRASRGRSA